MSMQLNLLGRALRRLPAFAGAIALALGAGTAGAQDGDDEQVEEIVVTGTQIRGARINEALPVSVISFEDIEAYGIDSGDELLDLIPENAQFLLHLVESDHPEDWNSATLRIYVTLDQLSTLSPAELKTLIDHQG